jgi:HPt (histidine-containing phosphotransfer) domain-containing protein
MYGFVAKPVRKSALAEAILGSLGGGSRREAPAPAGRAVSGAGDAEPALLDRTAVEDFVEDVGSGAIGPLLATFVRETERRLALLRNLSVGNPAAIHLEAHTLKGSSGLFGLLRFSALARDLERSAGTITVEEFAAALDRLEQVFAESRDALLEYAQAFKSSDALAVE